ncbi:hypothetical protein AB0L53_50015 [Nonomuraea sp. NPDC052129]|uniref:hypothetical protein n=1 Tax=unclassified Nonomuraea TaxID=2593643 RepID=UPI0033FAFC36
MNQIGRSADLDGVFAQAFTPRFYEIDGQGVMFNMWYPAYVEVVVIFRRDFSRDFSISAEPQVS